MREGQREGVEGGREGGGTEGGTEGGSGRRWSRGETALTETCSPLQ